MKLYKTFDRKGREIKVSIPGADDAEAIEAGIQAEARKLSKKTVRAMADKLAALRNEMEEEQTEALAAIDRKYAARFDTTFKQFGVSREAYYVAFDRVENHGPRNRG